MTWAKRLLYWIMEDFVSIDHLNVVMKEQYKARNCIVARYDQKFIDQAIDLVKPLQQSRIALQRIEDLKEEFDELDKISVGLQMERDTHRDDINENIAELRQLHDWYTSAIGRIRQLEISMIEKGK